MPRLPVDLDVIRYALLDSSLAQVGDAPLQAKLTAPVTIGRFSIRNQGAISAVVLNRPEDRDADRIFGATDDVHIPWQRDAAWVKTTLDAEASGRLPLGVGALASSGRFRMTDYRLHAASEGAVRAIRRNLSSFRTLVRLEDVRRLRAGEALSLALEGEVTAGVRLSWADLLANSLRPILSALGIDAPVAVRIRSTARAEAAVKVRDRFQLVISRNLAGVLRFTLLKAVSENHSLSLSAGVGGEASLVPAIEEALEPLFEAITTGALRKVESLAVRIGIDRLSAEERDLVARIVARLHLDTTEDRARAVREGVARLKRELRQELERALAARAAAAFAYEYARIEEETAIADYLLADESLLPGDHARAVAGDFTRITETLRGNGSERSVLKYLNETTRAETSSSGFSLGIGKWIDVGARDQSAFRQTTRTSVDGFKLVTFRGTRQYDERNVPQNDFEWTVDFKAQMTDYRERPQTADFDFGLHYAVHLERRSLSRADLDRMLDFAAMWGVRTPRSADLADALGKEAVVRVELLFDRDDLSRALSVPLEERWPEALASAMPWMASFPERRSFERRRAVYREAWGEWLRGASHPAEGWNAILAGRIDSGLRIFEERGLIGSFTWTAGEGHPRLRDGISSFSRGLGRLAAALPASEPPEAIERIWQDLRPFWAQRIGVAGSGVLLLEGARLAGADVRRSLRIELDGSTIVS